MLIPLRIGCPVWACADWRGSLYTRRAERKDYLTQYSQVYSTVEGNSTFYALPSAAAVSRWAQETPESFRFCFKFPSEITHRRMLRHCGALTQDFLQLMAPLQPRLGPFMIQLGPRFGASLLDVLRQYLRELPGQFDYSVEVRHADFFDAGPNEAALNDLLRERGVDRVIFDARCMYAASGITDPSTEQALARKPLLPLRLTATSSRPLLRFIGQNTVAAAEPYLEPWADQVVAWIHQGLQPYCFTHTPDDRHAPQLARLLYERIAARLPLLPALPAPASEQEAARPAVSVQLALF